MADSFKIAVAQLNPVAGDITGNMRKALDAHDEAGKNGADILVLPECYLSGYQVDDLVRMEGFLERVAGALDEIRARTATGPGIIIGAPRRDGALIHNSVFVFDKGETCGVRDKVKLAGVFHASVFDDARNFAPGGMPDAVELRGLRVGVPVCEDIWTDEITAHISAGGADMFISPNGSPFEAGKRDARLDTARARVAETGKPVLYVNLVGGVDDEVFDGGSFAVNPGGGIGAYLPCFEESLSYIEVKKNGNGGWHFSGAIIEPEHGIAELWRAITLGIRDYTGKNGFARVLLGLSGGIDSAVVAALAVDALGASSVDAVMMPSPFTSDASREDAKSLAKNLGIGLRDVDITAAMQSAEAMMASALPDGIGDTAGENMQARLRGIALMAISNTQGQMLLTTGNKSEYAAGYATIYGDMCGSYAPLIDCWKGQVYDLARWRNGKKKVVIPERIITRAPSAELRPGQKDSDSLPDYDILDPIMRGLVEGMQSTESLIAEGHDAATVHRLADMMLAAEFKRRQCAPGPKVSSRAFYRDRRFPIINRYSPGGGDK